MTAEAELLANLPADGVRVWKRTDYENWYRAALADGLYWYVTEESDRTWYRAADSDFKLAEMDSERWVEITPAPTPSIRDQRIAEAWERWPDGRLFENSFASYCPLPGAVAHFRVLNTGWAFTEDNGWRDWGHVINELSDDWTEIPRPTPTLPDPSGDTVLDLGVDLIWQERDRQLEDEGYSYEYDRAYVNGELVQAALAYLHRDDRVWPWDRRFFKLSPDGRVRELTKAGALIAAEIDRLLALPTPPRPNPLDGKPGSLWRDPDTGGIYYRTANGKTSQGRPLLVLIDGDWNHDGWVLTAPNTEVVARLVQAEEGEQ